MNLVEIVKVTSSEEEVEKFLRTKGILKTFVRFKGRRKVRRGRSKRVRYQCLGCLRGKVR
jgi:predicted SAM-dependent methyltransferase